MLSKRNHRQLATTNLHNCRRQRCNYYAKSNCKRKCQRNRHQKWIVNAAKCQVAGAPAGAECQTASPSCHLSQLPAALSLYVRLSFSLRPWLLSMLTQFGQLAIKRQVMKLMPLSVHLCLVAGGGRGGGASKAFEFNWQLMLLLSSGPQPLAFRATGSHKRHVSFLVLTPSLHLLQVALPTQQFCLAALNWCVILCHAWSSTSCFLKLT